MRRSVFSPPGPGYTMMQASFDNREARLVASMTMEDETMSNGSWSVSCKQDPRFNLQGSAGGMAGAESAMNDAIRAKQKELGMSDADIDKLTIETSFFKD